MSNRDLAKFLDNANHNAESTKAQIEKLCQEVLQYGFNAAFVNSCWVEFAKSILGENGKVGTVVSFPLGQDSTEVKINSCLALIGDGADELDISANVGWLRSGMEEKYFGELQDIVRAVRNRKEETIVKFIIEAYFLDPKEIKRASKMVMDSGADFVKTTSGFGPRDAKIEYVKLIKEVVGDRVKIKAAGGISTAEQVKKYLAAGACRIGTSKAVEIVGG
ncbi:MAG: deoxyribose-phosphate aldolase [Patescibacteria group bacterium]|nr:deoxyribose-phosphate aldolase [Patescibacteria group bacterium]